jgi:hypothetical protein
MQGCLEGLCRTVELSPSVAVDPPVITMGPSDYPLPPGTSGRMPLEAADATDREIAGAGPHGEECVESQDAAGSNREHPPAQTEKTVDPFWETIHLVKGCGKQVKIVEYLWKLSERKAPIDTIAKDVYRVRDAELLRAVPNVRRQLERTRDNLDSKEAPLRLIIAANWVHLDEARPAQ